jgi:TatD DNase family protein
MIDSHCHLADEAFANDLVDVVSRARAAGVERALCILSSDEPDELTRAEHVSAAWQAVQFAAAIHPHRAGPYVDRSAAAAEATREAIQRTNGVVIGEIGLDYHYDFAPREVQRAVFAAQIELALELDLPVAIHTREAMGDTMQILRDAGRGRLRGVMHCFSGGIDEARSALDLGFLISLAGIITFPKAEALRDVARFVPADRLLVETDAPFLAPVPHRGKRNEPAFVAVTLARLADLKAMPPAEMIRHVTTNFDALVRADARLA